MRVVLQRVSQASVDDRRAGGRRHRPRLLPARRASPTATRTEQVDWMAEKVAGLRLFSDAEGKMNLGLAEVRGAVLVISQFTLYGDTAKGRRPSFIDAARPEIGDSAVPALPGRAPGPRAWRSPTGEFGADMQVEIHNDGPVTLILDRA